MEEEKIIMFLRCPAAAVVDLALAMANLTWKEETAINLCGKRGKTQERAAEEEGYSRDGGREYMMREMGRLMNQADSEGERDVIRRCMEQLERM